MKKSESVRIEIKDISEQGITVFSYKRSEEIFVDASQLKANFQKRLKTGTPIILRFVLTRPHWILSERFVHDGLPVYDDYALKPKINDSKPIKEEDSEPIEPQEDVLIESKIKDKIVVIKKENQFNKGWTLFSPFSFDNDRNIFFKRPVVSNIVKLITFSNVVNLVLSDICLPSNIVSELEWANKYIKINVIAKDKSIIDFYNKIEFHSKKIDESININFIGIIGKNNGYFLLGRDIVEVDESINDVYFSFRHRGADFTFLKDASELIVCSAAKHNDFSNLLEMAKKHKVECHYVIDIKSYDKSVFEYSLANNLKLYVSEYVEDSILVINVDGSIHRISILPNGCLVLSPVERINNYVGDLYKCLFCADNVKTDELPKDVYSCFNGRIDKLVIEDCIIVEKDVFITEMCDFVSQNFDMSITESHNEYSNRAKAVEYRFRLIPPLYDSSFAESSIYDPIHKLHRKWMRLNSIKFDKIIDDYQGFMTEDSELISFINFSRILNDALNRMISRCDYNGYHSKLKESINVYKKYHANIINDCSFMFKQVNSESSGSKFDKFDIEIDGYRKTIKEKEKLVSEGIEILSNKRRIEILNRKISDLLALKEKFECSASARSSKESDSFIDYCKKIISGASFGTDVDSIGKIVNVSEGSKIAKLNAFVTHYLKQINDYVVDCLECLKKMEEIHIPEEYPVYEKNNQRYIVINELDEYYATKDLRDEFSLKCLARR